MPKWLTDCITAIIYRHIQLVEINVPDVPINATPLILIIRRRDVAVYLFVRNLANSFATGFRALTHA